MRGWLDAARQDVRQAVRQLQNAPAFTLTAVLTLAIGLSQTTAVFSALYAVVLHPLPFREADRLIDVATLWQGEPGAISVGNYGVLQQQARSFVVIAARTFATLNLTDGGDPERLLAARVSHTYFEVLGLRPELGRTFGASEDEPGRSTVAVLSHRFWQRRFGADRGAVGRQIRLSDVTYDVIGVMPPEAQLPGDETDLWTPIAFTPEQRASFDAHYLTVTGRLAAGVTRAQLDDDLQACGAAMVRVSPRNNEGRKLIATGLAERIVGDYRERLLLLSGAVVLVLLIACVNVASLLLARGTARARELAVRLALGAGRGRVARQLLTEAFVLCAAGALLALPLAFASLRLFVAESPPGVPRLAEARMDGLAVAVCFGGALAATLVAGLLPALRASRWDVGASLGLSVRGDAGGAREALRHMLVAGEVGLALMLLMGAGLLVRSGQRLARVDPGFDATNLLSARLALPISAYPGEERPALAIERIVERVQASPQVLEAAASSRPPLIGDVSYGLLPEGRSPEARNRVNSRMQLVTPGYLEALKIPLRAGRTFTTDDRRDRPRVMIVSETLARLAFPGADPLGKRIACCEGSDREPSWKEIVGVVADTRARGLAEPGFAEFYLPMEQAPRRAFEANGGSLTIVARAKDGRPEALADDIRRAVRDEDPALPVYDMTTMTTRLRASTAAFRFNALLLSWLGSVGLMLAAVGIYGVIAYLVGQRTREIGVRMALGATPAAVVSLVLRQGSVAVLVGLVLGGLGCLAQARAFERLLFGVEGRDPATLLGAAAVLLVVALGAGWLPARRAAALDPSRALRDA